LYNIDTVLITTMPQWKQASKQTIDFPPKQKPPLLLSIRTTYVCWRCNNKRNRETWL